MRPPRALPTRRTAAALTGVVLVAGALSAVAVVAAPAGAAGTVTVHWRGNGHGRGMSQYGARGAALQGLTAAQIVGFYYPGTTLTPITPSIIRVRLSNTASPYTNVLAGTSGLSLTGYGTLPATGYTHFRLVPYGTGLALQGDKTGHWTTVKTGLPGTANFSSSLGWVQSLNADGSSTRYHGTVGAVRVGAGESTINRVGLDQYVEGSVPREVPASWPVAAVRAQAIAARSYAEFSRAATGSGSYYDICDTTACQSYGGMAHYDASGHLLWSEDPDALINNANLVLRYQGQPVFAQYSASNGGATVDGGRPYLVGRADPYDGPASGDPYLDQSRSASLSSVAASYGLRSVSSIEVTQRDGFGPWGGRVVSADVIGTNSSGAPARVATTGSDLGDALGVFTDYLVVGALPATPSAPTALRAVSGGAGALLSWSPPASPGTSAVSAYRVRFGTRVLRLPGSARSVWVGPLNNFRAAPVWLRAINAQGDGPVATVYARGIPRAGHVTAVTASRLFDTRSPHVPVDTTDPFRFTVPGHGDVPSSGAASVQLSVSIMAASDPGVLTIAPSGMLSRPMAALDYRPGRMTTATVSVPLIPSGTLVFSPSAGHVELTADVTSYASAAGALLTTVAKRTITTLSDVPTGSGTAFSLAGLPGITSTTTGVLLEIDGHAPVQTWLRVWPDGTPAPNVAHVTTTPSGSANTFVVPLTSSHRLRIDAGAHGSTARIALVGVLGPAGLRLVTFPPSALADDAGEFSHSLAVGASPVTMTLAGVRQVAPSGVDAVLVEITVTSSGAGGSLWVHPAGSPSPAQPAARFGGGTTTTSTALLRLAKSGAVTLQSSVPGVRVALDAIGYSAGS